MVDHAKQQRKAFMLAVMDALCDLVSRQQAEYAVPVSGYEPVWVKISTRQSYGVLEPLFYPCVFIGENDQRIPCELLGDSRAQFWVNGITRKECVRAARAAYSTLRRLAAKGGLGG